MYLAAALLALWALAVLRREVRWHRAMRASLRAHLRSTRAPERGEEDDDAC